MPLIQREELEDLINEHRKSSEALLDGMELGQPSKPVQTSAQPEQDLSDLVLPLDGSAAEPMAARKPVAGGDVPRLVQELKSPKYQLPPELAELRQAQKKRALQEGVSGVSDALYGAFTRTPTKTAPMTDPMQQHQERAALKGQLDARTQAEEKRRRAAAMEDPNSEESRTAREVFAATPTGKAFAAEMGQYFDRLPASKVPGAEFLIEQAAKKKGAGPLDPSDVALKEARARLNNAQAKRLENPRVDPIAKRKRELEVQKLEKELAGGGVDEKERLQIEKLRQDVTGEDPSKVKKAESSAQRMRSAIDRLKALHAANGPTMTGDVGNQMGQLVTEIQMEAKNLAELGALSGPDMDLMRKLAGTDPTSLWVNTLGSDNTQKSLDELGAWVDSMAGAAKKVYGTTGAVPSTARPAAPAKPQAAPAPAPTTAHPTGRTKTDKSGVVWEEMSDGTARRRQ